MGDRGSCKTEKIAPLVGRRAQHCVDLSDGRFAGINALFFAHFGFKIGSDGWRCRSRGIDMFENAYLALKLYIFSCSIKMLARVRGERNYCAGRGELAPNLFVTQLACSCWTDCGRIGRSWLSCKNRTLKEDTMISVSDDEFVKSESWW